MLTYWRFYWPLALTGVGMVLSVQFQNATLARYPDAVKELAVLALAHGVFGFFNASLQFIAQLSNVYARAPQTSQRCWRFVVLASVVIMAPMLLIAITQGGGLMLRAVFSIGTELSEQVQLYLLLMCPLIILNAQRHYLTGLMVQAHRTGWVTICNFVYLGSVIVMLLWGFAQQYSAARVVVGAELAGVLVLVILLLGAKWRVYQLPTSTEQSNVSYRELLNFFIPVSTTGVMFALSRPVLFAFVVRAPDGLLAVAALRIAFDFSMLFQQAANQFRHFFISFGFDDLPGKKRFMWIIASALTVVMLLFAITPAANFIWQDIMGVPAELMQLATEVLVVMCLMPAVIIYRNYFHGRLMHMKRTAGMAYGAIVRVIVIFVLAGLLFMADMLSHTGAAAVLIIGFAVESAMAQWGYLRLKFNSKV